MLFFNLGVVAFSLLHGTFFPLPNTHMEVLEDRANLINFLLVTPAAVYLLFRFNEAVRHGLSQLFRDGVVRTQWPRQGARYLARLNRTTNDVRLSVIALLLSVLTNGAIVVQLRDAWNDYTGGAAAWWTRAFTILNFYLLYFYLIRFYIIATVMRRLFSDRVRLQPLHPDGCGGLRSLGDISLTMNYGVCLLAVYISNIIYIGGALEKQPLLILILPAFAVVAAYLFFAPLSKAHDIMLQAKERTLSALNSEFQNTYLKVSARLPEYGIPLEDAQKIEALERLHSIASRMPVWPMDLRIFTQFLIAIALPVLVGVAVESLARLVPEFGS